VAREDESPVAPTTETERSLARMWSEVLRIDQETIGIDDQFVTLGGDSMLAVRLAARVEAAFGLRVPLAQFFLAATISEQANLLANPGLGRAWRSLVPIQSTGELPPLFCVHGVFGDVLFYRELAQELGSEQPLYGLQARGLDGIQSPNTVVAEMAAAYIEEIRETQPDGPYCLLGYSAVGSVAYEMAQQLVAAGMPIAFLGIVDHEAPGGSPLSPPWTPTYAIRFSRNIPMQRAAFAEQRQSPAPGRSAVLPPLAVATNAKDSHTRTHWPRPPSLDRLGALGRDRCGGWRHSAGRPPGLSPADLGSSVPGAVLVHRKGILRLCGVFSGQAAAAVGQPRPAARLRQVSPRRIKGVDHPRES
jgi:acyl carrier protein